jgi:RimJ/RimL family protein N-acetyltransferase
MNNTFKVSRLEANDFLSIADLFKLIAKDPTSKHFHPHPFTDDYAKIIAEYKGQDLYLGAFINEELVGYAMLRGWDADFKIPSLGIYLVEQVRGRGFAKKFMYAIHQYALEKNAPSVRLKVYTENLISFYCSRR